MTSLLFLLMAVLLKLAIAATSEAKHSVKPEPTKLKAFSKEQGQEVADLVEFAYLLNNTLEPSQNEQAERTSRLKNKLFGELKPEQVDPEDFSEEGLLLAPLSVEEEEEEEEEKSVVGEAATTAVKNGSGWDALKVCITFGVILVSSLIVLAVGFFIASKKSASSRMKEEDGESTPTTTTDAKL